MQSYHRHPVLVQIEKAAFALNIRLYHRRYGNRHFWRKGYYVDTAGRNEKKITEYVRNQLQVDQLTDQMGLREYFDPFTGEPDNKGKNEPL